MKDAIKKFCMISLGLFFALLFLEIALRVVGYSSPPFITMDAERGWSPKPNQQGWTRNEGGKIYLTINSEGFRDVEHTGKKGVNTVRIVLLGDSYAEAAQVPLDQTFWWVMRQQLSGCTSLSGKNIEVINLGVDGYGTDQELLTLREKGWRYNPDIVLLAFTPSNDITDNSHVLAVDKDKPFFSYGDGKLVMDTSFKDSTTYRVRMSWPIQLYYRAINRSRVLQLGRQVQNVWRQKRLATAVQGSADSLDGKLGLADRSYIPPDDPTWNEAWQVTETLLQQMNNEVQAKGAAFLVVTVTRAIQVSSNAKLRSSYMQRLGVDNLFYPEERIAAIGKRDGFQVLNLAQPFQDYATKNNQPLHFPAGHWNVQGNQLAGQMIADKICAMRR